MGMDGGASGGIDGGWVGGVWMGDRWEKMDGEKWMSDRCFMK